MFLRDIAGLKISSYCEDPTSISTASAHLVSHGNRQTSYEVRVTPILPIQKKGTCCLAPWECGKMRITKEARAALGDKRDIMLDCVIDRRRRYPSHDGFYRDYFSTYEAGIDY